MNIDELPPVAAIPIACEDELRRLRWLLTPNFGRVVRPRPEPIRNLP